MNKMEFSDWHAYFKNHNEALKSIVGKGDPWVFLCGSVTIEYLAKICFNKVEIYVKFIKQYMSKVDHRYVDFKFKNGKSDLPDQMYYVLRNGLVHTFTLKPLNNNGNGRTNSIVLSHVDLHLTCDTTDSNRDSCVFNAKQFINDLGKAIDFVFEKVKSDLDLQKKMENHFSKYPPVTAFK